MFISECYNVSYNELKKKSYFRKYILSLIKYINMC